MLASIPASEIVTVLPSVLGAGGTAMALNAVIISDDVKFVAKEYSNADAVGNDSVQRLTSTNSLRFISMALRVQLLNHLRYSFQNIQPLPALQN